MRSESASALPRFSAWEPWLRFLAAVAGLSVALLAAMLSTTLRQDGNLWGTAILASFALVVAGAVGVGSVPYLARRVALHRTRDVFNFEITRTGFIYLVLCLTIGIAALNTGNNLLFIVLSAMLSAVLVSGIASAWILRGLELEAELPEHVFAREPVLARLGVRNRRRLPALSIFVAPAKAPNSSQSPPKRLWLLGSKGFRAAPYKPPQASSFEDAAGGLRHKIFTRREYFPFIAAKSIVRHHVELSFPRRGWYSQSELGLSTRFPLSFFMKTRHVKLGSSRKLDPDRVAKQHSHANEVLVYPAVEAADELFQVLPIVTGELENWLQGRGHDLYRLRAYVPGDPARHVDWKATARTGTLQVREFTREDDRRLRVVFDNPPDGRISSATYERGVALAASLAWHFWKEQIHICFVAPGFAGSTDVYEWLRYLALVTPRASEDRDALLENLPLTNYYNVILTTRPRGGLPTSLWSCSYFLFLSDSSSRQPTAF